MYVRPVYGLSELACIPQATKEVEHQMKKKTQELLSTSPSGLKKTETSQYNALFYHSHTVLEMLHKYMPESFISEVRMGNPKSQ